MTKGRVTEINRFFLFSRNKDKIKEILQTEEQKAKEI